MRKPRQPDPEVHESDYRIPAAVGTAAWTIALIVLLLQGDRIPEDSRWWIWVCVTGIALGVFGFWYVPRLLRSRAEAEERRRAQRAASGSDRSSSPPSDSASDPETGKVSRQSRP